MSILTQNEILKAIRKKRIKIEPFNEKDVGPASIDLTLDNKFRVFKKGKLVKVNEQTDYKKITKSVIKDSVRLKKGDMIIAITREKITLPDNICGFLHGRSRFARLGVMVHVSSAFVQPGVSNKQVLEFVNLGHWDVELRAGTKICHLILEDTLGKAKYNGLFKDQRIH